MVPTGPTARLPELIGGWPFLDDACNTRLLLTAVAAARLTRAGTGDIAPTDERLAATLHPAQALLIRQLDLDVPAPLAPLPHNQDRQVTHALDTIARAAPQWTPLLDLPMSFHQLRRPGAVSASNFAWPQHVFLAPAAFDHPAVLAEQVLHETCHQWLYLCEELWPLQTSPCGHRVVLPSGTSGRSPAELLGALHVVAALNLLWRWPGLPVTPPQRAARLDHLSAYHAGCLNLLPDARPHLTAEGLHLADHFTANPPTR